MRFRSLFLAGSALLALVILQPVATRAATVSYDGSGDVSSITDLQVGTNYFDITFIPVVFGQTYNDVYGSSASVAYSNALQIASAIVTELNSLTPIPDTPVISTSYSGFFVPYSVDATTVIWAHSVHNAGDGTDPYLAAVLNTGAGDRSTYTNPGYSWVRASPTATPLPAAFPLFGTGLGAFGLLGWRRKQKAKLAA